MRQDALLLTPTSLQNREMQTHRFDNATEKQIQAAALGVLQDLGYTIQTAESRLGLLTGSKKLDLKSTGGEVGWFLANVITYTLLNAEIDHNTSQVIYASLVTTPQGADDMRYSARILFRRVVYNDEGKITQVEMITNPELYRQFFERMSKSLYLTREKVP